MGSFNHSMGIAALGLSLLLGGCSRELFKNSNAISNRGIQRYQVDVDLNSTSFSLMGSQAYVNEVDILCDDKKNLMSFKLTPDNQKITLERDLAGCEYLLKSFVVAGQENQPIAQPVYRYSQATGSTKDGVIFSVFDLKNDKNDTIDRKLVTSSVKEDKNDCPDKSCFLTVVTVKFEYSEIQRNDVILENNLKIQEVRHEITEEPAPRCAVSAKFLQSAGKSPTLEILLNNCSQLFAQKDLVLGVGHHTYKNIYHVNRQNSDPGQVVGLNELIDQTNLVANLGSGSYTISLTLEQLVQITGKTSWIAAVREDLVMAIRNKGGKSVSYYVIDNTCTSDLVDKFQDVLAKKASWTLSHPGLDGKSYYKISDLVFDPRKPAVVNHGFCIDTDRSIEMDKKYNGEIFLSYDIDYLYRKKLVERPAAMPAVNWILGRYLESGTYTAGELQKAIWHLLDDRVISNGIGVVDDTKVAALVAEARRDGATYVPAKPGDWIAIVMIPEGTEPGKLEHQATIAAVKIPTDLCVTDKVCK